MLLITSLSQSPRWILAITIGSVALQPDVSVQAMDFVHSRTIKSLYDIPHPPGLHWNDAAAIDYGGITGLQSANESNSAITPWHPRTVEYSELTKVATIQEGRLEVVHHPALGTKPVLVKRTTVPEYIESISRETEFYRLLDGLDVTPLFLGHVTEAGVITGFLAEYIEQQEQREQSREERLRLRASGTEACLSALRRMHGRRVAHGDAHGGNCLVRGDGSAVLVDFELAEDNSSGEEFERDLWVMKHSRDAEDSD